MMARLLWRLISSWNKLKYQLWNQFESEVVNLIFVLSFWARELSAKLLSYSSEVSRCCALNLRPTWRILSAGCSTTWLKIITWWFLLGFLVPGTLFSHHQTIREWDLTSDDSMWGFQFRFDIDSIFRKIDDIDSLSIFLYNK